MSTQVAAEAEVVRITTFRAQPGHVGGLRDAAQGNAASARKASGCLSADVCADPDDAETVMVVSRWQTTDALNRFLGWHESMAHGAVSPHLAGPPVSAHHSVLRGGSGPA